MHRRSCLLVTRVRCTVWYAGAYVSAYQILQWQGWGILSGMQEHMLLHTRQSSDKDEVDCLLCWSVRYCIPDSPPHPCHQQAALPVHYTTSCKHSLVLLWMGEIIARNILSWLGLLIKLLLLHLVGCLYYRIIYTRSHKHQIYKLSPHLVFEVHSSWGFW